MTIITDRRTALLGATTAAMAPLIGDAHAVGTPAVGAGGGELLFISGASLEATEFAEWESEGRGGELYGSRLMIATGKEQLAKAPKTAARYTQKRYNFPSGSFRVLHYKKGGPVVHQIVMETEILILQGSVELSPLYGVKGPTAKLSAGDALFLPGGVLKNPNPTEDTILLLAQVEFAKVGAKGSIVYGKDLKEAETVQWVQDGKEMTARNADEAKAAPANAARYYVKRYVGDGNSIRYVTMKKGKTNNAVTTGRDVIIYIPKGRLTRVEGDHTFEMVAGDAVREKLGNPGHWVVHEDGTVFIATDAPMLPVNFAPTMAAAGGMMK